MKKSNNVIFLRGSQFVDPVVVQKNNVIRVSFPAKKKRTKYVV